MSTVQDRPTPKGTFYSKEGAFVRPDAQFRSSISSEPGAKYPPEKGRYHLYVSYACPWAHRTLIVRALKGLEEIISVSAVHPHMSLTTGWRFPTADEKLPGEFSGPDPWHEDVKEMRDLYFKDSPDYTGRYSVPVLWDKRTDTIVSNESSEIIRMLNTEFNSVLPGEYRSVDLYPKKLREQIDEVNDWMYHNINNGVYKSGVAKAQEPYDVAVKALFEHLDRAEEHLSKSPGPYYLGKQLTEVDVRLFVTIIRFDPVYVGLFKCNIRDIRNGYPAIHRWLRNLYWDIPAFRETTNFDQIKIHYWQSLTLIMPAGIIPTGPVPHILPKDE